MNNQHEQNQVRDKILSTLEDNKNLQLKLNDLTRTGVAVESKDDATRERLTSEALKNVKKQVDYLQTENHELRALHVSCQKTITNLEHEIQNYRQQLFRPNSVGELKQKYTKAIKILESTIKTQAVEIAEQAQVIQNLEKENHYYRNHLRNVEETLQAKLEELAQRNRNYSSGEDVQRKLDEQIRLNKEQEKSLEISKRTIDELFEREKSALHKVQEALAIAESAVSEKESALWREQVIKEEFDQLASTIGQVMDDAAKQVERDTEALRKKHGEREKKLMAIQEKLQDELKTQKKYCQIVETRCNRVEQKYKDACQENSKLHKELNMATRAMDDMVHKMDSSDSLIKDEDLTRQRAEQIERQMESYLQTNKELKEKYRATIQDMTQKFENEIYRLQNENANLRAENQVMKLHRNSYYE